MSKHEIPDVAFRAAQAAYTETLTELRLAEGGGFGVASQHRRALDAAVIAADEAMFSEAAIERVARARYMAQRRIGEWVWEDRAESEKDKWRHSIRETIQSLKASK